MYYRIELINQALKSGLCGLCYHDDIVDAWIEDLRGPKGRPIPNNAKFYFTELGWEKVGRKVIDACQKVGQNYKVIRVKNNKLDIVWKDRGNGYEIAAQIRKERYG